MIDWSLASGFALASFGISVTPGPSWLYVLSVSLSSGRQAGFCAVAGNATGISGHVLAALLGLSALITHEPRAYLILKWCGAVYLCWLGIKMIPLKLFRTNSPQPQPMTPSLPQPADQAIKAHGLSRWCFRESAESQGSRADARADASVHQPNGRCP